MTQARVMSRVAHADARCGFDMISTGCFLPGKCMQAAPYWSLSIILVSPLSV
jgi:hypothetical protein